MTLTWEKNIEAKKGGRGTSIAVISRKSRDSELQSGCYYDNFGWVKIFESAAAMPWRTFTITPLTPKKRIYTA